MSDKKKLVVIGNGMAGARTVEEILRRGPGQFEITMFGDEPYGNYNRIMLSNVLSGAQQPSDIFLNPLEWYRENGITLYAPARVTAIDRDRRTVVADNGVEAHYDILLFATGSRPFMPKLDGLTNAEGELKGGIFGFRTIDDCRKIAGRANKCRRALVLGGGLLGLEAARGLLKFGVDVHLAHIAPHLMNAQLDPAAGAILKKSIAKLGVHIHLNKRAVAVLGDDETITGVRFEESGSPFPGGERGRGRGLDSLPFREGAGVGQDGSIVECDMLVVSAGITPNVELARDCGLTINRAVVVDDRMQSVDDDRIFVVGECAEHRGKVYGLVAPLWEQGRIIAEHLTGSRPGAVYHGSKVATKLKAAGISLATMGIVEPEFDDDEVVLYSESKRGIYQKLILRDGIPVGGILLGDTDKAASLIQAFDHGTPIVDNRREALFDNPVPGKDENPLLLMPDEAKVCNCMGLTKGAIRRCVEAGNTTLPMVQSACKAGMGCGSCKPLVQEIITWVAGDAPVDTPPTPSTPAPAALISALPFDKPEVAGAVKTLIRELVNWACAD